MSIRSLVLGWIGFTAVIAAAGPPTARVGEVLRSGDKTELHLTLPDQDATLTLAPDSVAVLAEGGHDLSLNQGSAQIRPLRASLFGIQTADIGRRANARIESADGGTIALRLEANHDVIVSVTGGTAQVSLLGWPGAHRVLPEGTSLRLPAEAEKIPAD